MKHLRRLIATSLMAVAAITAHAQFFTIQSDNDTSFLSRDPYLFVKTADKDSLNSDAKLAQNPSASDTAQAKSRKKRQESFNGNTRNSSKSAVLHTICMTDSLLLTIIKKRLNVCMPLSSIYLTSDYGYRRDPFKHCISFHDGIDLRCREEVVYNMLPGKVEKVGYDGQGYGNYIIINHGKLQFLYGHLNKILIKEGAYIDAGTAIAISGQSGQRVTGPHLHIRMSRLTKDGWKSVAPNQFITYINEYINELNAQLYDIIGDKEHKATDNNSQLSIPNLYDALKRHKIKFPKIVLAQAILESGWNLNSDLARNNNNLFGLRHANGYHSFTHWEKSVLAYKNMVQYKYKGGDYLRFLKVLGYASDPAYINKVKQIASRL